MTDLREQVARAYEEGGPDAAIAAVLRAQMEPSEGMVRAGCDPFDYFDSEDQIAQCWANMLTAFASEHDVEIEG